MTAHSRTTRARSVCVAGLSVSMALSIASRHVLISAKKACAMKRVRTHTYLCNTGQQPCLQWHHVCEWHRHAPRWTAPCQGHVIE